MVHMASGQKEAKPLAIKEAKEVAEALFLHLQARPSQVAKASPGQPWV